MRIKPNLIASISTVAMFFFSNCIANPQEEVTNHSSEAIGQILWQKIENENFSIDVEELIIGMRKEASLKSKESIIDPIAGYFLENQQKNSVYEIEPSKLQFETLRKGYGLTVQSHSKPLVHFSAKYLDGSLFGSTEFQKEPVEIDLDDMIVGLKKGIVGMREGEVRRLYIHPDLAYGKTHGGKSEIIVFDIQVVQTYKDKTVQAGELFYSFYDEPDSDNERALSFKSGFQVERVLEEETPIAAKEVRVEEEVIAFQQEDTNQTVPAETFSTPIDTYSSFAFVESENTLVQNEPERFSFVSFHDEIKPTIPELPGGRLLNEELAFSEFSGLEESFDDEDCDDFLFLYEEQDSLKSRHTKQKKSSQPIFHSELEDPTAFTLFLDEDTPVSQLANYEPNEEEIFLMEQAQLGTPTTAQKTIMNDEEEYISFQTEQDSKKPLFEEEDDRFPFIVGKQDDLSFPYPMQAESEPLIAQTKPAPSINFTQEMPVITKVTQVQPVNEEEMLTKLHASKVEETKLSVPNFAPEEQENSIFVATPPATREQEDWLYVETEDFDISTPAIDQSHVHTLASALPPTCTIFYQEEQPTLDKVQQLEPPKEEELIVKSAYQGNALTSLFDYYGDKFEESFAETSEEKEIMAAVTDGDSIFDYADMSDTYAYQEKPVELTLSDAKRTPYTVYYQDTPSLEKVSTPSAPPFENKASIFTHTDWDKPTDDPSKLLALYYDQEELPLVSKNDLTNREADEVFAEIRKMQEDMIAKSDEEVDSTFTQLCTAPLQEEPLYEELSPITYFDSAIAKSIEEFEANLYGNEMKQDPLINTVAQNPLEGARAWR